MKPLFIFLLLICVKPVFSQSSDAKLQPLDKIKLKELPAAKLWRGYLSEDQQKPIVITAGDTTRQQAQDNMPVVKLTDKQVFLYNNKQGSDVYVSSIDNMRVLKPDATFASSLPVKR